MDERGGLVGRSGGGARGVVGVVVGLWVGDLVEIGGEEEDGGGICGG